MLTSRLVTLFDAPTVRRLAEIIEQKVLEEVVFISDEEAMLLRALE